MDCWCSRSLAAVEDESPVNSSCVCVCVCVRVYVCVCVCVYERTQCLRVHGDNFTYPASTCTHAPSAWLRKPSSPGAPPCALMRVCVKHSVMYPASTSTYTHIHTPAHVPSAWLRKPNSPGAPPCVSRVSPCLWRSSRACLPAAACLALRLRSPPPRRLRFKGPL